MVDQLFFVRTVKNKIIKTFNFLFFLFLLFFYVPLVSDDDIQFVLGINDLPIFNEMKNMPESLVIFDKLFCCFIVCFVLFCFVFLVL